jgi:hypothetical protein
MVPWWTASLCLLRLTMGLVLRSGMTSKRVAQIEHEIAELTSGDTSGGRGRGGNDDPGDVKAGRSGSRRARDILVPVGDWKMSYTSGTATGGMTRLQLYRVAGPGSFKIVERDPRDGDLFPSESEARNYALGAGRLEWMSERKRRLPDDWEAGITKAHARRGSVAERVVPRGFAKKSTRK